MIKKILIIVVICLSFANISYSFQNGVYISPKFIYSIKGNNNMFVGAGASIGYNFNILSKYSPIRVEFEYLYKNGLEVNNYPNNIDNINIHSMLFNAYYDINLIYINYDGEENNIYRNGKRHIMTISLGFSLGGNIDYNLSSSLNEKFGLVKNYSYNDNFAFMYGPNISFGFHLNPTITLELGYRLLLDTAINLNHDVLLSMRLNF
ncbi:outer membrane protein [Brachyspira pilosicoli]|mgnify:FL=1|uniref:outer membrane protein n=1 Tax=Brachyspira pilosicoli TaxID=52584 RepID=UPI000C765A37|nr:tia invasion determinant [Brachyspira pilosicoli]PLV64101.1 tia invasion determinant [Brachyspira pilosicoli SP16]